MSLTVEDEYATQEGPGMAVGHCMGLFYEDNGMVVLRDPEWIQEAINVFIGLFWRVELMANVENSNTMKYQPGEIHTGMSENTFIQREKIEGGTYRDHLLYNIPCPDWGVGKKAGFIGWLFYHWLKAKQINTF